MFCFNSESNKNFRPCQFFYYMKLDLRTRLAKFSYRIFQVYLTCWKIVYVCIKPNWRYCLRKSLQCSRIGDIYIYLGDIYRQTCIRRPLLRRLKNCRLGQVVVLYSNFIKGPQTKSARSWQIFSFCSHCECLQAIEICQNKYLQFCVFWCHY